MNTTMSSGVDFDTGNTAWMLGATALVVLTTIPGLIMYYAGIQKDNNISTSALQILVICSVVSISWMCWGYSLTWGPIDNMRDGHRNHVYGDGNRLWFRGLQLNSVNQRATTIPEAIFCAYELTFAMIAACLVLGGFGSRMKIESLVIFVIIWHVLVYCPIAHTIWHTNGWLARHGDLDYAGGNIVHINAGISSLMLAIVIGNVGKPRVEVQKAPQSELLTTLGLALMWVGFYAINAGKAYAANTRACYALLAVQIATASSTLWWLIVEKIATRKITLLGAVSGAVSGLIAISPASGYVDMNGAFFIGMAGGVLCYFGKEFRQRLMGAHDDCDGFGIHAVGGMVGGIATAFFANKAVTGVPDNDGVYYSGMWYGGHTLAYQICGILFTAGWAGLCTLLLALAIEKTIGLKEPEDTEVKSAMELLATEEPAAAASADAAANKA